MRATDWPLVGRGDELRLLRRLLIGADPRAIVLAGPAGVGKTRLARQGRDLAEQAGLATAWVTATRSAAELPFGALAPILPATFDGPADPVTGRTHLLRQSAKALVEQAAGRRLLLVVDDAHLLDDGSATLVHQLVATDAAAVLVSVRAGARTPDPVTALWKDELAFRIDIPGLSREAIDELLDSVLEGPVDPAAAAELAFRCQGNALFLRELVLGALNDGSLQDEGGIWRLAGPLSPSERLTELVDARFEGLDARERSLLELLSYGEPLGTTELATLGDPGLVEALERRGLVTSQLSGRRVEYRLAHPVYGDVIRARIPGVRRRAIARSLAEAVESTGARRREDTLRVASWRLEGGGARPDLMLSAATIARWRYDFPLAERLAVAAVSVGAGFEAELLAAQINSLQGHAGQAEQLLAALGTRAETDSERARLALARLDNLVYCLGRSDDGLAVATDAEATITDQAWRDELAARKLGVVLATQGPGAGAAAAEPLLERAEGSALVWACLAATFSYARLGRFAAALEVVDRGSTARLALSEPMEWYPWYHVFMRCEALCTVGRFGEADELARIEYAHGLDDGSDEARAFFAWNRARAASGQGHVRTAIRQAREALTLFRQLGRRVFISSVLVDLASALALGGRPVDAQQTLGLLEGNPPGWSGTDPLQAQAWIAVASGDVAEGRRLMTEAAAFGEQIGDLVGTATALHALARLGAARDVAGRLAELAPRLEGELSDARAAHARALASNDADGLMDASTQFETMGADLYAAEAAADAAVAWRRAGRQRNATAAQRRATNLADLCEGASTPALRSTDTRVRLTAAQLETATLAAAGHSDKEIAELLHLSVRTIENRLQKVYERLGISGRKELAEAIQDGASGG